MLVLSKKPLGCPMFEVSFTYQGEDVANELLSSFESEFVYGTEAITETPLIRRGLEGKLGPCAEGAAWLASKHGGKFPVALYDTGQLFKGEYRCGVENAKILQFG